METIKKMRYVAHLRRVKERLEEELNKTKNEIKEMEMECEHISVVSQGIGNLYLSNRCLFCAKVLKNQTDNVVYAINYKKGEEETFDIIQSLVINILKENPELTTEELIGFLNSITGESKDTYEKYLSLSLEKNKK